MKDNILSEPLLHSSPSGLLVALKSPHTARTEPHSLSLPACHPPCSAVRLRQSVITVQQSIIID